MQKVFSIFKLGVIFFILIMAAVSCKKPAVKQAAIVNTQISINKAVPKISGLTDLGGLDIPLGGGIPTNFSDGRYSPGEWILVRGNNLGATSVDIDGISVKVDHYFGSNPLIRVPANLAPLKKHQLKLQTDLGIAQTEFYTSHYIATTDTDGKKIHLIRTNHDAKGGVEEDWLQLEEKLDRPMFVLVSPDSRFLYAINIREEVARVYSDLNAYQLEIFTYHLANPNNPALIKTWKVDIGSSPIDASINPDGTILLLGKRSFTLVNASNPLDLKLIGSKRLPDKKERTTFVDAVFLNGNQQIAALETYSNTVYLFENNAANNFPLLSSVQLQPSKTIPLSVDLEVDNKNNSDFWVLEGPNYRLGGDSLEKLYKKIFNKPEPLESERYTSQLQKVHVDKNQMSFSKTIPLPNNYVTFFSKFGNTGKLNITMTKFDFINAQSETDSSKTLLKKMTSFLWDSIAIGRVIALDVDTGKYDTVSSGVGLYYDLVDVPDIGPVFSLLKFGPSFSFPYLSPSWGVGIKSTGTYAKRAMDGHAIFPPYSVGFVVFQY